MSVLNVSIEVSAAPCSGACITIIIAPKTHCKHPIFPWNDNRSFKKMDDKIALHTKKNVVRIHNSYYYFFYITIVQHLMPLKE